MPSNISEERFAVVMSGITKIFGEGFKANDSVDLKVKKGSIHALVGENGAGKSTLMKILYGMYHPDEGTIRINETEQTIDSPLKAISLGIGMVHQHFMLVNTLTVLENIILGDETTNALGVLNKKASEEKIYGLLKKFNITLNLNARVENLSVGAQQKIEILKILYRNADILILDEPTAVLTPQETDELFVTLKELCSKGKTIILITHKLAEVLSASDTVTVLRHGRKISEIETSATDSLELTKLIIGEEIEVVKPRPVHNNEKIIVSVSRLHVYNDKGIEAVKDVSFDIREGEILGIAGVEGNGQSELVEAISGLREYHKGSLTVEGKHLSTEHTISHIPADRHKHGIVMEYSIEENLILGRETESLFSGPLNLKRKEISDFSKRLIDEFDIRSSSIRQPISGLSGGNQQKIVAARELTKQTNVIIASHPTRGLDIKAAGFVHKALINESAKSKAVLVVSSDLAELLSLCDRVAVMYNGEITAILNARETAEREIGMYMTGYKEN